MRRLLETTVLLAIFVAGLFFAWVNKDHVTDVSVWPDRVYEVPVVVVVAAAFGIGVLLTLILAGVEVLKRNIQLRSSSRRIRALEAERDELRNLPLKEELRATVEEESPLSGPPPEAGL